MAPRIGPEANAREIPVVDHEAPRRREPLRQPRLPECRRRLVLARPVGARARRDAEETDPSRHLIAPLFSPPISHRWKKPATT